MDETLYPPNTRLHPRIRLEGFDYCNAETLYFVTICSHDRQSLFSDPPTCEMIVSQVFGLRERYKASIYAYCLMPDHLHMLLHLLGGEYSLGQIVGGFKSLSSSASWLLGHRGSLWQKRFYDHVVRPDESAGRIVDYILDNPVRKSLARSSEDWPYCGMPDSM